MSEIVIGDLVAWEPELEWAGEDARRQLPLSWAVTVHTTPPALPPLRGGELIVAPNRVLNELRRIERIEWSDIVRSLRGQAICGILVEQGFDGEPPEGIPLILAPPGHLDDVEARLNRMITEHRGGLYQVGSELSRALSVASIGGADLEALLVLAGQIGDRDLLLVDSTGSVIARSRDAAKRLPFRLSDFEIESETMLLNGWMLQRSTLQDGSTIVLAAGPGDTATPEATRFILGQTRAAIEVYLGPAGIGRAGDPAPSREALLAEILLGRLPAGQLESRLQALSIDPDEPYSVLLLQSRRPGFDGPIRTMLRREIRERICMLSPLEMAVVASESVWSDWWAELRSAAGDASDVALGRSEQRRGFAGAVNATRQARTLARLNQAGIDPETTVYDLLLPLNDPAGFSPSPERLNAFADRLLAPLETHDRERHSELVETLSGYLAAGGSTTGAADLLSVHRNTLGYRLRRIADLTGADLDSEDTRLAYGMALRIRRLSEMLE